LGKNGKNLFPVWPPKAQGSKNLELDHDGRSCPVWNVEYLQVTRVPTDPATVF
jgi:hypothetical protein